VGVRIQTTQIRIALKGALAVDAGYQPAKGQHVMAGVDSFGAVHKDGEPGLGAQLEFLRKF